MFALDFHEEAITWNSEQLSKLQRYGTKSDRSYVKNYTDNC